MRHCWKNFLFSCHWHVNLLRRLCINSRLRNRVCRCYSRLIEAWYQAWTEELAKLTSDPFLIEKNMSDAFVGIVADFLEHFESQKETLDSLSILNGTALHIFINLRVRTETCFPSTFSSEISEGGTSPLLGLNYSDNVTRLNQTDPNDE